MRIHAKNHHVWKKVRVGRARADGQFDIVHESALMEPNPVPEAVVGSASSRARGRRPGKPAAQENTRWA
ncbi:MAG: ABC transporter substrate-binding protein [Burkholderiaceae bacterium]|nr:ABC transporter substrate-binding protein [Burkholderiaceae bacterium]